MEAEGTLAAGTNDPLHLSGLACRPLCSTLWNSSPRQTCLGNGDLSIGTWISPSCVFTIPQAPGPTPSAAGEWREGSVTSASETTLSTSADIPLARTSHLALALPVSKGRGKCRSRQGCCWTGLSPRHHPKLGGAHTFLVSTQPSLQ